MRVLMVTPSYYPILGGSETAIRILSTMLNEMGIHTDVMTYNMTRKWNPIWREETVDNGLFRVFKVPAFNLASIFLVNPLELIKVYVIPKLSFVGRFREYDIIHFQGEADLSFPLFSFFVRKPKLWTSHTSYAKLPRLKRVFKLFFPRIADLYIAIELEILSRLGVPKNKSLPWFCFGVDVKTFRPDETKRIDNLILFVGRIDRIKGLHVLLEALSDVISQTQLVIIGPKWDPEYAAICMEKIKQVNSSGFHNVQYLGAMDEESLVPWYQKAAVLVRPDLDGFSGGLTSLEALACATPVIGTGNHLIKNGVNGLRVSPNNAKELAKAINQLLGNKISREEFGREGRRIVENQFSWKKIAEKSVKLYEAVLSTYRKQ
jgi:glycosyltransferase involved in cell wall biosynthesis